jgi:hypothetical protein
MDLFVLRHLEQIVRQGATIVGARPERTYGLRGYPAEEQDLRELAARLWGDHFDGPVERKHGSGRIVSGKPARDVLRERGIGPDFDVAPPELRRQIDFIHRRTANEDIYFVRNAGADAVTCEARFRVHGKQPELWDPVDGSMTPIAAFSEGRNGIRLPLRLEGQSSIFVVFTQPQSKQPHVVGVRGGGRSLFPDRAADAPALAARRGSEGAVHFRAAQAGEYELQMSDGSMHTVTVPPDVSAIELAGPWEVRFPHGWDVPVRQEFARLESWTESANAATRAFSGIATYVKQFQLPAMPPLGSRVVLDLGEVREVARVFLNGKEAGLSTFVPHRLDVTGLVRVGENFLVIDVANTWLNRLIADDALPEPQRKTHTNLTGPVGGKRWRDATPRPSGLLGPVRLQFPRETVVGVGRP